MGYINYHLRAKFLRVFGKAKPEEYASDDFGWRIYSAHYAGELQEIEQTHTTRLAPQDYAFQDGSLNPQTRALPLHPNHRLLYETVLQLHPQSVLEMGCGGGDHLYNLHLLAPEIRLSGVDRSAEQLALLKRRSPGLDAATYAVDITRPLPGTLPPVDLCFTQAVIMHIKTADHHLAALANLFALAAKQVVLMENWQAHPFLDDIRRLHEQGKIPWPALYPYFRRAPELENRPHLLVISATPLAYEPLTDYNCLTGN